MYVTHASNQFAELACTQASANLRCKTYEFSTVVIVTCRKFCKENKTNEATDLGCRLTVTLPGLQGCAAGEWRVSACDR